MGLYTIEFSPTGGTRKVTDILARQFETAPVQIDLFAGGDDFSRYTFVEEDVCIVAVPSFYGRVPVTAAERVKTMQGNGAQAVLIGVYGNRALDDTLLELKNILTAQGFRPVAAVAAVAEHSIMHRFGTGRPDEADEKELTGFAEQIARKLMCGKIEEELTVPGTFPYREHSGGAMIPFAGEDCTGCGLCAKQCPVGAISKDMPQVTDAEKCISCMHCIAICPKRARKNDEAKLAATITRLEGACAGRKENQLFLS